MSSDSLPEPNRGGKEDIMKIEVTKSGVSMTTDPDTTFEVVKKIVESIAEMPDPAGFLENELGVWPSAYLPIENLDHTAERLRPYIEEAMQKALLKGEGDFKNKSYRTVRYGWVRDFRGSAVAEVAGVKFRGYGVPCEGDAQVAFQGGWFAVLLVKEEKEEEH